MDAAILHIFRNSLSAVICVGGSVYISWIDPSTQGTIDIKRIGWINSPAYEKNLLIILQS